MGKKTKLGQKNFIRHKNFPSSLVNNKVKDVNNVEKLLNQERELTRDLIHELKAFNERMDSSIGVLFKALNYNDSETIKNTALSIKALEELGVCRMELYEYLISPQSYEAMAPQSVSIYKEVEKIYKSINGGWADKARNFELIGNSYSRFKTKRIISVGLFIILENAWKYSHPDEPIVINFNESNSMLELTITNWGPLIEPLEFVKIYKRGYRGNEAQKCLHTKGKGLGLDIAKRIFTTCDVKFEIVIPDNTDVKIKEAIRYTPFKVKLEFSPLVQSYAKGLQ